MYKIMIIWTLSFLISLSSCKDFLRFYDHPRVSVSGRPVCIFEEDKTVPSFDPFASVASFRYAMETIQDIHMLGEAHLNEKRLSHLEQLVVDFLKKMPVKHLGELVKCDLKPRYGKTFLMEVIDWQMYTILEDKYIMSSLINSNSVTFRDSDGNTIIHLAAFTENAKIIRAVCQATLKLYPKDRELLYAIYKSKGQYRMTPPEIVRDSKKYSVQHALYEWAALIKSSPKSRPQSSSPRIEPSSIYTHL